MAKYRVETDKGVYEVETEDKTPSASIAASAPQVPRFNPKIPGLNSPGIPGQDPTKPGIDLSGLDSTEQQLNNRGSQAALGTLVGGPFLGAMNAISPPSDPGEAAQTYGLGAVSKLPGAGMAANVLKNSVANPALDWLKNAMQGKETSGGQLGVDSAAGAMAPLIGGMLGKSVDKVNATKAAQAEAKKVQDLMTARTRVGQRLDIAGRDLGETVEARAKDLATGSKITPDRFKLADQEKWQTAQKAMAQKNADQLDDILAPYMSKLPEKQASALDQIKSAAQGIISHGGGLAGATYLMFHGHPLAGAAAAGAQGAITATWPKIISSLQEDPQFGKQFVSWMKNGASKDIIQAYPAVQRMLGETRTSGTPISLNDLSPVNGQPRQ